MLSHNLPIPNDDDANQKRDHIKQNIERVAFGTQRDRTESILEKVL